MFTHNVMTHIRRMLETTTIVETVTVPKLTLDMLFDWFDLQESAYQAGPIVGFTYAEYTSTGAVSYLQGLFCLHTAMILQLRRVVGQRSDRCIDDLHRDQALVIYT